MDYKSSLNLPNTKFPMKANLPAKEPERLKKWSEIDIYKKILDCRDQNKKYVLHDGPPYANGHLHMGHALNKILKDFIIKIKSMQGYYAPYVPGWDCHGLPIEHQVDKLLGKNKHSISILDRRKECRKYADKFIDIQRDEFKRLGIFGGWDNPYVTMDYQYETVILGELYKFFDNKLLYKGAKPVYWCTTCITALAEAEVEYKEHTSYSIFVKFKAKDDLKDILNLTDKDDLSVVIWTTTPWTLPANLAVAVHPNIEYSLITVEETNNKNLKNGELLILATEMIEKIKTELKIERYIVLNNFKGSKIENNHCKHPFYDRNSKVILGNHVTLEQGTGIVHTAPGHGVEDYEIGLKYGLDIYNPVDDRGRFKNGTGIFDSLNIFDANIKIINYIDDNGCLLYSSNLIHSYPHCWRCKKPVIYRATPQWFISMEKGDLRKKALESIDNVRWIPAWGKNRIYSMIENRPDWCVSRQRSWGVPIALFICSDCNTIILNSKIKKKILESFENEGADAWFAHDAAYFVGDDFKCPNCGSTSVEKEKDILDVWFDSGTSHAAVCETNKTLSWPANMYLEGSDQHRGWFHSSLLESVGTRGVAPYKEVLTHGFVVDGKGRKMSKSEGNVVNPFDIINKHGAEILRLWVAAEDYTDDIRFSDNILKSLTEAYRKIRNTCKYLLSNLYDFNSGLDSLPFKELLDMDQYILIKWQDIKAKIYAAVDNYQFHVFYHTIMGFCINDLSAFYMDILKDRLYTYKNDSHFRKAAQTTIFTLARELCVVIAPILSFTGEEIWEYLPEFSGKSESVFMEKFPVIENIKNKKLENKWEKILEIRKNINKSLEVARAEKKIGHPLDAKVTFASKENMEGILSVDEGIEKIFIISELEILSFDTMDDIYLSEDNMYKIKVEQSELRKCERCWRYDITVGDDVVHKTVCSRCLTAIS